MTALQTQNNFQNQIFITNHYNLFDYSEVESEMEKMDFTINHDIQDVVFDNKASLFKKLAFFYLTI